MGSRPRGAAVGERIARERDRQEISLSAFSRRVTAEAGEARGTSRTALRNLEEGRVDSPSKDVVEAVARVLGVEEAWLWTGERPKFSREAAAGPRIIEPAGRPRVEPSAPPRTIRPGGTIRPDPMARSEWPGSADPDRGDPVDVPAVPEAHPVWGPGVARTIASRSLLARGPAPVRTRFWSVLRVAADHPRSGMSGPDDMLRLARQLDDLVLRPLDLLRPHEPPEGVRFEDYALSLLDSVESLLDGSEESPSAPPPDPGDGRHSPLPPSFQKPRAPERREREGLTWRLM